jgi:hypothetical protein
MTLVPELRTELQGAARRYGARGATPWWRRMSRHRPRMLIASGGVALCLVIVVALLLVSATSSTSPAYALTRQSDGSITLRLYTLTRGITQLNDKLRELGIDETVVPIVEGCPNVAPAYPLSAQETITLRPNHYDLAPGDQGFIAARQLPDGQVSYAQGAMAKDEVPSCFGTTQVRVTPTAP